MKKINKLLLSVLVIFCPLVDIKITHAETSTKSEVYIPSEITDTILIRIEPKDKNEAKELRDVAYENLETAQCIVDYYLSMGFVENSLIIINAKNAVNEIKDNISYYQDQYDKFVEKEEKEKKKVYKAKYFYKIGIIYWQGYNWTWYSQRVLPGGGLDIPGRHKDKDGFIKDKNGYICLASSTLKKGTIISTPFGTKGKIYDSGCDVGYIDTYVGW